MSNRTTMVKTFPRRLDYFRKEENCFDQSATAERLSENKLIASGAGFSANTDQNQTYNIQQTIFLNQLPVVPNQQLVYQVEGVQNLNNLNFGTNGNGQQNLVYIVIPGANANESVQLENLPLEVLKKEKDGNGQGIEFIRLDDEKRVGPTDGLVRDADIKRDKLYLNNAAVQVRCLDIDSFVCQQNLLHRSSFNQ